MPLDINPKSFDEHPLIQALRLAIYKPIRENKKMVLACILLEGTTNSTVKGVSDIIKKSDINVGDARCFLESCSVDNILDGEGNINGILAATIEGYLKLVLQYLEK